MPRAPTTAECLDVLTARVRDNPDLLPAFLSDHGPAALARLRDPDGWRETEVKGFFNRTHAFVAVDHPDRILGQVLVTDGVITSARVADARAVEAAVGGAPAAAGPAPAPKAAAKPGMPRMPPAMVPENSMPDMARTLGLAGIAHWDRTAVDLVFGLAPDAKNDGRLAAFIEDPARLSTGYPGLAPLPDALEHILRYSGFYQLAWGRYEVHPFLDAADARRRLVEIGLTEDPAVLAHIAHWP